MYSVSKQTKQSMNKVSGDMYMCNIHFIHQRPIFKLYSVNNAWGMEISASKKKSVFGRH
jgi:hypothetical protein